MLLWRFIAGFLASSGAESDVSELFSYFERGIVDMAGPQYISMSMFLAEEAHNALGEELCRSLRSVWLRWMCGLVYETPQECIDIVWPHEGTAKGGKCYGKALVSIDILYSVNVYDSLLVLDY